MRLKDLAALVLSIASLLTAAAGFVKAFRSDQRVTLSEARQDENAIHTAVQEGQEDMLLRAKLEKVEKELAALRATR